MTGVQTCALPISYTFDETSKKLTGKYSDGENWAYDYTVSGVDWLFGQFNQETGEMSGVGETMVMTAADDSTYKLTFVYGIIPDEVINSVMVRSAEGVRILPDMPPSPEETKSIPRASLRPPEKRLRAAFITVMVVP